MESRPELLTEAAAVTVSAAIARRVSCRAYRTTPLPEAHLMRILEAARLAPSASNQQPWRFAVVRDPALRRRVVEEGFLPGSRMTWAFLPFAVVIDRILSSIAAQRPVPRRPTTVLPGDC